MDCYDVLLTCVPSGSGKHWTGTGGIGDPHFWQKCAKGSDRRGAEQCAHLETRVNWLNLVQYLHCCIVMNYLELAVTELRLLISQLWFPSCGGTPDHP